MLTKLFGRDTDSRPPAHKEGELFKTIELCGRIFEIRYGFYEEQDRHSRYAEPIEIYPDFIKAPQYTDDGKPFITAIQTPCKSFEGKKNENSTCEECSYYRHGDELLGICTHPDNIIKE